MNPDLPSNLPPVNPVSPSQEPITTTFFTAPEPTTPPSNGSSKKLFMIAGIVLALLILVAIIMFAVLKMQTPTPTAQETPLPTSQMATKWKPYSDSLVSFEIPANWNAVSSSDEIYSVSVENTNLEEVISIVNWSEQTTPSMTAEELQTSLTELYNSPCELDENGNEQIWYVVIEKLAGVNGNEALSLKGECGDDRVNSIFVLNGSGLVIQMGIGVDDSNDLAIIDQIVASFEFTQ